MHEYIPGIIIVGILALLNLWSCLHDNYKAWKLAEMKRQKVLGSSERHIDLRG